MRRSPTDDSAGPLRVALMLPGRGYTSAMPLLFWTTEVLTRHGWTVQDVTWPESLGADRAETVRRVAAAAIDAERGGVGLIVGKSLGSLAIPIAAQGGLPGIWHTPLFDEESVRSALADLPKPSLLIGGGADPSWDGGFARASGHDVCEVAGADHGISVPGGPAASARAQVDVVARIEAYVESLG